MPEETFETPQPAETKPLDWPRIILAAVLGLGLLAGAAYAGYWYGTQEISNLQLKTQNQVTPTPTPTPTQTPPVTDPTADWGTYANEKYGYSLKYPQGWEYLEVPNQTYQTVGIEQVWFSNVGWPPPQTGARAPIVISYHDENPEEGYRPEFFNDYKKENILIGGSLPAIRITGFNKEGLFKETVVILVAKRGANYITFLPSYGRGENTYFDEIFDQILSTFRFLD